MKRNILREKEKKGFVQFARNKERDEMEKIKNIKLFAKRGRAIKKL